MATTRPKTPVPADAVPQLVPRGLPDATLVRLAEHYKAIRATLTTAAEIMNVPSDWYYDPETGCFMPPVPAPNQTEEPSQRDTN